MLSERFVSGIFVPIDEEQLTHEFPAGRQLQFYIHSALQRFDSRIQFPGSRVCEAEFLLCKREIRCAFYQGLQSLQRILLVPLGPNGRRNDEFAVNFVGITPKYFFRLLFRQPCFAGAQQLHGVSDRGFQIATLGL